jgi:hypothetical protein
MQYLRSIGIVFLGLGIAACVQLADILQTKPVRTLKFTGSHHVVAQCVHARLGGKFEDYADRLFVYDAVKGDQFEGLTHFAVTIARTSPDTGVAEWRIKRTEPGRGPSSGRRQVPPLSETAVQHYWAPVRECAKSLSRP